MQESHGQGAIRRLVSQMVKSPVAVFVSSMEMVLSAMRDMQTVFNESVDRTLGTLGNRGNPGLEDISFQTSSAAEPELVRDTFNGLVAFVVPGPDAYSVAQGVSTEEPGGIDARITDVLILNIDHSQPSPAQGPPNAATVAALLNKVAQRVNPSATGVFLSPFARLSFAEKAAVFAFIEGDPSMMQLRRLGGILAFFVAVLTYSEAGVFDFETRTLTGQPVGWAISSYEGVADGRDEFKGYFEDRQKAESLL